MLEARPQYVGINAYYRPFTYARPVVEVEAPTGWIGLDAAFVTPGVFVETPGAVVVDHREGAVVAPGVGIEAGIHVAVPMPSIAVGVGVDVGGPPVIVRGHHDNGRHEGWHKGRGKHR
jgi:hypothetical protein